MFVLFWMQWKEMTDGWTIQVVNVNCKNSSWVDENWFLTIHDHDYWSVQGLFFLFHFILVISTKDFFIIVSKCQETIAST